MFSGEITIFSIPKAFNGHTGLIQTNAIQSWLRLEPVPRIILCGNDEGTYEVCREFGLIHIPDIELSDAGTPLVSSVFEKAQSLARGRLLAYVNADIVLFSSFTMEIARLPDDGLPWLAVGRRHDLMVWDAIDFTLPGWDEALKARVHREGILDASSGIDYFAFTKGLYLDIPAFAVGRTLWDNWLLWHALNFGGRLIDMTRRVMAVHQDHPYTHAKGGAREIWNGLEARRNWELAQGRAATIKDANFCLDSDGVQPFYEQYRMPEPMMQDMNDFKFRQSVAAYVRGRNEMALDLLDYLELWSKDDMLQEGYCSHKIKVLTALGKPAEALDLIKRLKSSGSI